MELKACSKFIFLFKKVHPVFFFSKVGQLNKDMQAYEKQVF